MRTAIFDFETTGLNPYTGDKPFALSITFLDNVEEQPTVEDMIRQLEINSVYFEWDVDPYTRVPTEPSEEELAEIRSILENESIIKVGHNIKFDMRMAEVCLGIKTLGPIHDTQFMVRAQIPDLPSLKLKPVCKRFLGVGDDDLDELKAEVKACRRYARKMNWKIVEGKKKKGEEESLECDYWLARAVNPDSELCYRYCLRDSVRTALLYLQFQEIMNASARLHYEEERELMPVVYEMEGWGLNTSLDVCRQEQEWCENRAAELRPKLVKVFGEFNKKIPDPVMRDYLFNKLGLSPDPTKLTAKKKEPQVTADVLKDFANVVPILEVKMEYDQCKKAAGTYFENYIRNVSEEAGYYVLRANFNQMGAVTTRLSCRNPNLQNAGKRGRKGSPMLRVRRPFRPRSGYYWLHLDWKAIEARIFAEEANETDMLRIFAEGGDVYQTLVERIEELTGLSLRTLLAFADSKGGDGARQICKNNFLGWTYGEGVRKMARAMHMSVEQARTVIEALKNAYPKARPFMDRMQRYARRHMGVVNRYAQFIPVPPPRKHEGELEEYWYMGVNRLIQSTAARMMKRAMVRVHQYLQRYNPTDVHLILTVHDELVVEIRKPFFTVSLVNRLASIMKATAEEYFHQVEFPVDAKVTKESWDIPEDLSFKLRFDDHETVDSYCSERRNGYFAGVADSRQSYDFGPRTRAAAR